MSATSTGGVVTAVESDAAEAGGRILRAGGNAADAAVAAAFAEGVVNPVRCGIGGGMMGQFHDGATGQVRTLWSMGRAPRAAHATMFTPTGHWGTLFRVEGARNQLGYQASVVPGFVRGAYEIHRRFGSGRISWKELLLPAIELAHGGFRIYPHAHMMWSPAHSGHDFLGIGPRTVTFTDAAREIFTKPDGSFYEIGELFVQSDYGRTLERIAEQGPDEFYSGETGARIAADFAAHDGLLSQQDLLDFVAEEYEPLSMDYRDHRLVTEDAPSVGPTYLQIMNTLEGWDLAALGWNSVDYLDRLARAMHLAFRDRAAHIGDPQLVDVPLDRLLSKEYAAQLREQIESGTDVPAPDRVGALSGPSETTHVTVVDEHGNAAAITHSIGSGSGVVTPGLGFLHNNHMIQFDARPDMPNSIAPWKRPNAGGAPVFAFKGAELVLAMGSPAGGRKATAMAQVTANVLDFGMSMDQAVSVDRIHAEDLPLVVSVEPSSEPRAVVGLAVRGHQIVTESYTARVVGVHRDPVTHELTGGSDPRGDRGLVKVAGA